ncbi:hypothetical protein DAI22_02g266650 [Oryza sativa Japonica Group]|nr:hypothetical protein DAI22_02g266650 [Oryza sativa Japonica Group]
MCAGHHASFVYKKPLYIDNAAGLSFSLLVFFATSFGCITVLVLRRVILGAELGGPRMRCKRSDAFYPTLTALPSSPPSADFSAPPPRATPPFPILRSLPPHRALHVRARRRPLASFPNRARQVRAHRRQLSHPRAASPPTLSLPALLLHTPLRRFSSPFPSPLPWRCSVC